MSQFTPRHWLQVAVGGVHDFIFICFIYLFYFFPCNFVLSLNKMCNKKKRFAAQSGPLTTIFVQMTSHMISLQIVMLKIIFSSLFI